MIKTAIIGCGRVAGHHARSMDQLTGKVQLQAVCDLREDRGEPLAEAHGVPFYTDYNDMLRNEDVDVVSIVSPSGMHFEHALDVVELHGKHVVIEKPMVMTPAQAKRLKDAADAAGVTIFPVFQYRFNKAVQRMRKAVEQGELGEVFLATVRTRWCRPQRYYDRDPWRGTFSHDGGACTNQGIHHLDLLRYLGGEIESVNTVMDTYGADIEVEDCVVGTIRFKNGASGVIEITTAARPDDFESSISLVGSKGIGMIGGWATNELVTFSPDPAEENLNTEEFPDVYGYGHKVIYEGVYDVLQDGGSAAVEFEDGLATLRLLHAIYRSDEDREWIKMDDQLESRRLGREDDAISALYRTPRPE